jgi:hypothetical protein
MCNVRRTALGGLEATEETRMAVFQTAHDALDQSREVPRFEEDGRISGSSGGVALE